MARDKTEETGHEVRGYIRGKCDELQNILNKEGVGVRVTVGLQSRRVFSEHVLLCLVSIHTPPFTNSLFVLKDAEGRKVVYILT